MDMREAKNSKTARKKLLESGIKVDSSTVSCLSSDNTLMNENTMKELTENKKQKVSRKKRKDTNISEADVAKIYPLGSQYKAGSNKPKSETLIEGKGLKQKVIGADVTEIDQLDAECEAVKSLEGNQEKKKRKFSQKKREKLKVNGPDVDGIDQLDAGRKDCSEKPDSEKLIEGKIEKVKNRRLRKDRLKQKFSGVDVTGIDQLDTECEAEKSLEGNQEKKKGKLSQKNKEKRKVNGPDVDGINRLDAEGEDCSEKPDYKLERSNNRKKEDKILSGKIGEAIKEDSEPGASEVYHISSVDADSSKGMKKWINEYYQHRPGLKILQQRIDEFITTHQENEEQARKDKEALAADGGWTVVVHQKGRKKTTDAESGTAVGSVAQAAVVGYRSQKKIKDFGVDFYRFQKREAQRNEIMVLQNKFEEDKKRIQQLRSARKFRPY